MKINPRHYPLIVITTYVVFLLAGLLLGFMPDRGQHGRGAIIDLVNSCLPGISIL